MPVTTTPKAESVKTSTTESTTTYVQNYITYGLTENAQTTNIVYHTNIPPIATTTGSPTTNAQTSNTPSKTDRKTTTTTSKVNLNPCNQNPCNNNGMCLVNFQLNTYTCFCRQPYKGTFFKKISLNKLKKLNLRCSM
jgi:hypothetical protein